MTILWGWYYICPLVNVASVSEIQTSGFGCDDDDDV